MDKLINASAAIHRKQNSHFFGKLAVSFSILIVSISLSAQVTIGSAKKPLEGTLLMLDDGTMGANGENSKKGLGLPRVELKTLTPTINNLAASIGATGIWNEEEHIGLVIYNAKKNGDICPGIHVWDGTNWVEIAKAEIKSDINMTDEDGNIYNAKWFFADPCEPDKGAYWTTSNLYSTQKAGSGAFDQGSDLDNMLRLNPAFFSANPGAISIPVHGLTNNPTINYGESTEPTTPSNWNMNVSQQEYAKIFGLSYTHHQATQLCPSGWLLPDDNDWIDLAKATVHSGAEVAGAAMRAKPNSNESYYFRTADNWEHQWGALPTEVGVEPSGFDALPAGSVDPIGTHAGDFSYNAFWWSASTSTSYRYLSNKEMKLYAFTSAQENFFSVRCIKK